MSGVQYLLETLSGYVESAKFWTVVDAYEEALVLRLGKYNRTLRPGLHWIIPFAESILRDNVVPSTFHVGPLSLTTKDGKAVIIGAVVTWSIADIKTFLLSVENAQSVIEDSTYGIIGDMVRDRDWDQIIAPRSRFSFYVEKRMILVMRKYGVRVDNFSFGDLTRSRTFRIIGWTGDE